MPFATFTPSPPPDERATFLVMLKEADGTACAGVIVHVVLEGPGFLLPGSGFTGGHRFIFARTDDSGGLRFQWIDDANAAPDPVSLRASATAGRTLSIRRL